MSENESENEREREEGSRGLFGSDINTSRKFRYAFSYCRHGFDIKHHFNCVIIGIIFAAHTRVYGSHGWLMQISKLRSRVITALRSYRNGINQMKIRNRVII